MAKTEQEPEKAKQLCPECNTEFLGRKCPQCGNEKGNIPLAADGIDRDLHRKSAVFGNIRDLRPTSELTDPDSVMRDEIARGQLEEMQANLRDSYVMKSRIRKKELELEEMRKEQAIKIEKESLEAGNKPPVPRKGQFGYQDTYAPPGYPSGPDMGQSIFPPSNPQVVFMTHLMKMDKEKRTEFLNSIAEAEPAAIATLSSLLAPAVQTAPQYNPYANPWGMPPWMMNPMLANQFQAQQGQGQVQQDDPVEVAISLISKVKDLVGGDRGSTSSTALDMYKEQIKDLKDEVKELRIKVANPAQPIVPAEFKTLHDDVASIKSRLENGNGNGITSVAGSVKQISTIVKDLEEIGLVQKAGSTGKTVDDEIKLNESKHRIEMAEKRAEIEKEKVSADKVRADMAKGMLGAMFQRSIAKRENNPEEGNRARANTRVNQPPSRPPVNAVSDRPPEIVQEFPSEGGARVYESRTPVKRSATGVL